MIIELLRISINNIFYIIIILYNYEKLYDAIIINRPSKIIKSPFVADISIDGEEFLAHTPSLGCCGLCDKGSKVKCIKINAEKCKYRVCITSIITKGIKVNIGIEPKSAERIAFQAILNYLVPNLKAKTIEKEKKFLNSRFDFSGITLDGSQYICEVKNVPLADYADVTKIDRKKMDFSKKKYDEKIAYFPDGYRKKNSNVVSERALKHVQELEKIKLKNKNTKCIFLFIVQRKDVASFQPSKLDPIYLKALQDAFKNGVEINVIQVDWEDGKAIYLRNDLPINLLT